MNKELMDHAQRGMQIIMRESYAKAQAAGQLHRTPEGHEMFQLAMPPDAPLAAPLVGARLSNGEFRLSMESMFAALGGDEVVGPWEHFEHDVHELAKQERAKGFGSAEDQ